MTQWSGYICPKCGTVTQHSETWQFNCRNCGYLVDPATATHVVAVDKTGHIPRKHCPFGDRCREDCQWLMLNGQCAIKKIAMDINRIIERRR